MQWWYFLVALLDLYILASVGSWLAFQIVEGLLQRSGRSLPAVTARAFALADAERAQAGVWPSLPRPGRYQAADTLALENLATLREHAFEVHRRQPVLALYAPPTFTVLDVLLLRAWPALIRSWRISADVRALHALLDRAEAALEVLQEQQQLVTEVPIKARAALNENRAEQSRLSALLEDEREWGTRGLEDLIRRVAEAEEETGRLLDALAQATDDDAPGVIATIDEKLAALTAETQQLDALVTAVVAERSRALSQITRLRSSLALADERWAGLRTRGATEPEVAEALHTTGAAIDHLAAHTTRQSVEAYREINAGAGEVDAQIAALQAQLGALDQAIEKCRAAEQTVREAMGEVRAACDVLRHQNPPLEPDQSLALMGQAQEATTEAERLQSLGTTQGFQEATERYGAVQELLAQAHDLADEMPEQVQSVERALGTLNATALANARTRLDQARTGLQSYPRHWNGAPAERAGAALADLEQARLDLERLPAAMRQTRGFLQSGITEALAALEHGQAAMNNSLATITELETGLTRVEGLRAEAEKALDTLLIRVLPELQAENARMLPEVQKRLDAFLEAVRVCSLSMANPAEIDYEQLVRIDLPALKQQSDEVAKAHVQSIKEYRDALRQALSTIDRKWAHLVKLDPNAQPGPDENIQQLAGEMDDWREDAERQGENPVGLRDILDRRHPALEARIDETIRQITEGRRDMDVLEKAFGRHGQAVRNLRSAMRSRQQGQWSALTWEIDEAEQAWIRAMELERGSRASLTLRTATEQMQRAVNAADQAEQLFARAERQVSAAILRLDGELRDVTTALQRARRRAESLRAAGATDELAALEELCNSTQQCIESAERAGAFEEALRWLRQAHNTIARA
ncbi:MAG: coiled-coil domain-containing protein [Anaerolineae bacterium]